MSEPVEKVSPAPGKIHVTPLPQGGWAVKRNGVPTPLQQFSRKREAVAYARSLGAAEEVVIHDRGELAYTVEQNGKIIRFRGPRAGRAKPKFGSAQGLITIAEDFEAPLEDFAEYTE